MRQLGAHLVHNRHPNPRFPLISEREKNQGARQNSQAGFIRADSREGRGSRRAADFAEAPRILWSSEIHGKPGLDR